jgi:3-hydroxymyristoyl/3-hydroxydecanoyl-(acyl carrier protein) dehydratase
MEPITDIEEIIKLIPQKPPMVMVDKLFYSDEKSSRSGLTIKEENIFVEGGFLKEPGIIEHIAQTAALRAGYFYSLKTQQPPIGFIGAIKNLTIHNFPQAGKDLVTEIKVEAEIMNATVISAEVRCAGDLIAEGEMKIFIMSEPSLKDV